MKIKVKVTNSGYGLAHNLIIESAQPKILENLSNLPITFNIDGSSPTANPADYLAGQMTIRFGDIPPNGGQAEGYWNLSTSMDGYFVEFSSTLKHQSYLGIMLDPLIASVNTILVPAIGGKIAMQSVSSQGMIVELRQAGALIGRDTTNAQGNYLIPDLAPGLYQWLLQDQTGTSVVYRNITVVSGQPTSRIDYTEQADLYLSGKPANPSNESIGTFTFGSASAGVTFACSLDNGAFAPCTSPFSYNGLLDGTHSFTLRTVDQSGNPVLTLPAYAWMIDTVPPGIALTGTPITPTSLAVGSFAFSSTDATARFQCKLDEASFAPCSSPFTFSGLGERLHTFTVEAIDLAGNRAPATHSWIVDTTAPAVTATSIVNGATGVWTGTAISATFNEVIDPATITTATFTVIDGGNSPIIGAAAYTSSSKTALLTPTVSLANGMLYTAKLSGVKDLAG